MSRLRMRAPPYRAWPGTPDPGAGTPRPRLSRAPTGGQAPSRPRSNTAGTHQPANLWQRDSPLTARYLHGPAQGPHRCALAAGRGFRHAEPRAVLAALLALSLVARWWSAVRDTIPQAR